MTENATDEARKTVLVTGGRGFIGAHLVERLASTRCSVVSLDTAPVNTADIDGVTQVVADVRELRTIDSIVRRHRIETIYDLASHTAVGLPATAYERNVAATRSMVDIVRVNNIRKYIFFSTQFVFRKPDQMPASDEDYWPIENYGVSKVASEEVIRASLPEARYLILRPTYIWGPGLNRFRDGLLYRLAKGQLLISSDPTRVRFYGYVRTVVDQARAFADLEFGDLQHRVYYISDSAISLGTFCDVLVDALGQGRAMRVPSAVIRMLGAIGGGLSRAGLPAPINPMQARELTTNFPVPIERTLELTKCQTNLLTAAEETVAWARLDPDWCSRTRN
ncbi:MAG TPA: NAD(P)-dependent oxidoreductase [Longimicrobiales bacterium]